jgi:hypothetical protein
MKKNKIISDWLDKYNDLEIDEKVKMKLEEITKERSNQIIDEVYNKYTNKYVGYDDVPSKELFIFEIKNNPEFSERWGLTIEERELSFEERTQLYNKTLGDGFENKKWVPNQDFIESRLKTDNIPTKLITISYNDTTIESYE